jgi:hypothetical protein
LSLTQRASSGCRRCPCRRGTHCRGRTGHARMVLTRASSRSCTIY